VSLDYSRYVNHKPFPRREMHQEDREEMRREYDKENNRLQALFWDDLSVEYNIGQGHPKWSKLMSKAWEHGHSGGLSDVEYWFVEFLEMLDL
jgi:hypothetical protein